MSAKKMRKMTKKLENIKKKDRCFIFIIFLFLLYSRPNVIR